MKKQGKRLWSILLTLAILLGMVPMMSSTAMAAGVTPDSKYGENGNILFTVDDAGVLTWSEVSSATSYDLNIWVGDGLFRSEKGLTARSYNLEAMLDQYKKDSGSVKVGINAWGGSVAGDTAYFQYCSPLPKLEAPANLHWDGMVAQWDDVPNANEYDVALYQATGGKYGSFSTTDSSFNFESVALAANAIKDGWFFKVKAINVNHYRDSEYNESHRKGYAQGEGVIPELQVGGTEFGVSVNASGVMTWDAVPGATSYDLTVWTDNGLFKAETGLTSTSYDLEGQLNAFRKDSGTIEVNLLAKGVIGYEDTVSIMYSSPYSKLEAPSGLSWYGNMANWNDVAGASGYSVTLYQPSGGAYATWTTTESQYDFASVTSLEEGWFFKVKSTGSEYVRDSVYNESPVKETEVSTQIWPIGAYVYNETLEEGDSGGQVYMENTGATFDWSNSGYTENAIQGTTVTVKAKPAAGYRFVEWRKGTKGDTISTDAEYTFTCVGPEYLYAIFKEDQTTPITGVSFKGISVPVVGEYVQYVDGYDLEEDISGAHKYRVIDNQTCSWRDEEGRAINYGAQVFEAGRTYSINFNVDPKDGYAFTSEDIPVMLSDLYDHEYTGSIELFQETSVAKVTFTFTLDGERAYDDIVKFRFYEMRAPEDGDTVSINNGVWAYNNAEVTDRYWTDSEGNRIEFGSKFVGGNSYFYNYEFTAFDGYKFAESLFVRANNEVPTNWEYIFNNERTTVHIKIPYFIDAADTVSSVVVNGMFVPNQTKSTRDWDSNVYLRVPNDSNYMIPLQTMGWYEVDAEYSVDTEYKVTEPAFRAGKQYKMFLILHAKDGYKFAPPEGMSFEFSGIPADTYTYTVLNGGSESNIEVVITFTAQFPDDVGENANNPAWCYSYEEFKCAMESNDIRYVALGNVEDTLPMIPHDEEQDPGGITSTAIVVRGTKDLNLLGDAVFSCPLTGNYDLKYYIQLLTLTDAANSNLYIHGDGSLTYAGGTLNFVNSVIKMEGGHLTVDGATVRGSNGYHTGFCYGINAIFGSVGIQGGATVIGEIYSSEDGISALTLGSEGVDRSLSVSIFDGKFYVERDEGNSDEDHGISVNNDIGLRIYGMSTDGIRLGRYAADTLTDYVMDGSVMTVDGVKTDPASCGTTSGIVEVYQEISKVDIHVNAPVAGKSPAMYPEDVYMVPDGATVNDPVWYENGQPWNLNSGSERFEAGSTYTVEITLVADEGVKFANPLTSATINYQDAEVSAFAGNAEKGVTLTVDLGTCSNTVTEVAVVIDTPRKNAAPDQYATIMGSGYAQAVDGIQWQKSSDGSNWTKMEKNENFSVGNYHRVFIDLKSSNGYAFALDYDLDPAVSGTVNGNYAEVFRYPEENPDELIFLRYDFGILNDVYIPEIRVNDIIAPVAGAKPSYTCTIGGNGYTINTAYSGGSTIDGIYWYDMTYDVAMTPNRAFTLGNQYKVVIDVKTEDGFEFLTEQVGGSYRPAGSGYINGNPATFGIQYDGRFEQNVQYIFTCGNQEISTIMLYDLEAPAVGKAPDTQVTAAYPEFYTVTDVTWLDEEDNEIDTFEAGRLYTVQITVDAKANNGVDSCFFADQVTAYIDGTEVTGWSNKVTTNDDNTVTIRYAFRKPAQAPTVQYYFFSDLPVGGEVFVGEALNVSWSTTWIPTKTEIQYWDGQMWDQWDVQYPANELDDYDFEWHDAESYTFRLVAYVGDDPRAVSSEFTVTWKEPVSVVQSGNSYDVTLEKAESGIIVMAAGYQNGKMTKAVCLTEQNPTAILTGDNVKVFFLDEEDYSPIRKAMELQP